MNVAVAVDIVVIAFAFMPKTGGLFDETNFFTNLGVHLGNFMALGFTIAAIILGMANRDLWLYYDPEARLQLKRKIMTQITYLILMIHSFSDHYS